MSTVLLVIHLMIAAALVGIVLVQKSEGGALGIGGGGGMFAGRGKANLMTRATAALGAAFFTTSLLLTVVSQRATAPASVLDQPAATAPATPGSAPAAPTGDAPAAPAGDAPRGGILDKLR
ncbi:MAG: preprotein translocase subunit SecG [Hyphomicrobium sp.]|nr:preprotein translocase subunit SecG [Hyphomicrobium sp.]PPD07599.1 MAG: preprotein translocase subunit SecG [Hyphomicrobium sp.]